MQDFRTGQDKIKNGELDDVDVEVSLSLSLFLSSYFPPLFLSQAARVAGDCDSTPLRLSLKAAGPPFQLPPAYPGRSFDMRGSTSGCHCARNVIAGTSRIGLARRPSRGRYMGGLFSGGAEREIRGKERNGKKRKGKRRTYPTLDSSLQN